MKTKFYIVTDIDYDTKFKTDSELEDLDFKRDNVYGVWSSEGRTEDERINNLYEKVQDYMGVYLKSLEFENNKPHSLTSFKQEKFMKNRRSYYIDAIRELAYSNFDEKTESNILAELDKNWFDNDGMVKLYNELLEVVYGDDGIKGY